MTFQKGNKYGFKPGNKLGGRKKGSRNKDTMLTIQLLHEAIGTDPETLRKMSRRALKNKLAKVYWNNPTKLIPDAFDRILGKPEQKHIIEAPQAVLEYPGDNDAIEAEVIGNHELTEAKKGIEGKCSRDKEGERDSDK